MSSVRLHRRIGSILAVVSVLIFLNSISGEELDYSSLRGLSQNGRDISLDLEFTGDQEIDTGFSYEKCLLFRDYAGRLFYFRMTGLSGRQFHRQQHYKMHLKFIGFAANGIPLAEAVFESRLTMADNPYEGDISDHDPRIEEIIADILGGKEPPASIRLRYSGTRGDYASFYDLAGREIYFKYREDRFDVAAEKKLADLMSGEAYLVRGDFIGLVLRSRMTRKGENSFLETLKDPDAILVYEFTDAKPLRLDQILF